MLNLLNTYRSFLFGLLIFSYVFSVFQKPVFETFHFICHIPSFIFSQEKIHSYDSHAVELHTHENLAAFYQVVDEDGTLPQPQSEQETKKKIEIIDDVFTALIDEILVSKKHFQFHLSFSTIFIKIPDPPPQFS